MPLINFALVVHRTALEFLLGEKNYQLYFGAMQRTAKALRKGYDRAMAGL